MRAYERFLKYVVIPTPSDENIETAPSSQCQFDLARVLETGMKELGLEHVHLDEKCHLYGTLPASEGCENKPAIGFIAHDLGLIQSFAHQIAVMYLGNIVEVIPAEKLNTDAAHPYTKALMEAVFDVNMDFSKKIESIESEAPSPLDVPPGCPFQDRCGHCMDRCRQVRPTLAELEPGHEVACHIFEKEEKKQ